MTDEEIAGFFNDTRSFLQGNLDLRDPQVEGWFRTRQPLLAGIWSAARGGSRSSNTGSHKVFIQASLMVRVLARQAQEGGGVAAERK